MVLEGRWAQLKLPGRMDSKTTLIPLLIIGAHLKAEGYPNTLFRLRQLADSKLYDVTEINFPIWTTNGETHSGIFRLLRTIWRTIVAHARIVWCYFKLKRPKYAYVPYPSTFLLFVFSLFPRKILPELIVADVFISLYDTVVLDRLLLAEKGWVARLLKWVEQRACNCADIVIVDTEENKIFLCALFKLVETKVIAIPLATDEGNFQFARYQPNAETCRVLFVGTFVPLHGIAIILEAIRLIPSTANIAFKLIGDGQDARLVEQWESRNGKLFEWERRWQSSAQLADEIAKSDICLGIFGWGDKTQRVCPFKIYAYAAVGRPIITGNTEWLLNTHCILGKEIIAGVAVNDPAALARKIMELAISPLQRTRMAQDSFRFYRDHLANEHATERINAIFRQHP